MEVAEAVVVPGGDVIGVRAAPVTVGLVRGSFASPTGATAYLCPDVLPVGG